MIIETQIIELKSSWRDEYLKWICGFANAYGGTLVIGKNDAGETVGVSNSKQLMEDIPNKVRDILGIIVDLHLHHTEAGEYIEIIVDPYPYPISYKGQYHYRSGSTKQELKGIALDKFLLQKRGLRWDAVTVPDVNVSDLKQVTIALFRKRAAKSQRISEDRAAENDALLLENLQLIASNSLKRAAILLFHPNPEHYISGAYVKIGFFESDSDLLFQDEVYGNLFEQIENTMDLLFSKYIKAWIRYEGIHRVENFEYPREAVREALLNAIAHKDYSGNAPIQISVYKDKIMIWNEGQLPEAWTINTLLEKHPSKPFNPDIANALFRSGYIEAWGRGIAKMTEICSKYNLPAPVFYYQHLGFWVVFNKDIFNEKDLAEMGLNLRQIKAMLYVKEKGRINNSEYQKINQCARNTATNDLNKLVKMKMIHSSGQKGAGAFYIMATETKISN
jgi:ATP-dependent DNA helicase RecG